VDFVVNVDGAMLRHSMLRERRIEAGSVVIHWSSSLETDANMLGILSCRAAQ